MGDPDLKVDISSSKYFKLLEEITSKTIYLGDKKKNMFVPMLILYLTIYAPMKFQNFTV